MNKITLSPKAVRLLLFQRSGYRHPVNRIFRGITKKLGVSHYYDKYLDFYLLYRIETLRTKTIAELYYSDLKEIFNNIKSYLPYKAIKILDIGAGMGGIDLLIAKYYNYSTDIFLLDKEGMSDKIVAGFHSNQINFSHYNSFSLVKDFLVGNGVPISKIHTIDISNESFPQKIYFDLIISFLSWGFHYPVDTYIEDVYQSLHKNGILIIDIRKGTHGEKMLEEYFGMKPICIAKGKKYYRFVVQKMP